MKKISPALATLLLAAATFSAEIPATSAAPAPVQLAAAQQDDTNFLFVLGLMEGHLTVGHDLLKANKLKLASPHFGHPVRELYDDLKDYLTAKRVPQFEDKLIALEAAVGDAPTDAATEQKFQAVIAAIRQARASVPASVRDSVPEQIKICADTIDAASGEYGESIDKGRIANIPEYHDSHGFVSAVGQQVAELEKTAKGQDADLVARFKAVLAKAQAIVGPLVPPERPEKSVGDFRAVAREAHALVNH